MMASRVSPFRTGGSYARRRRGYALAYLLALIPLYAVGMYFAYRGVALATRTSRVTMERANEYQSLNAWLDQLREDTRRSTNARIQNGATGEPVRVIIETADATIVHAMDGSTIIRQLWGPDSVSESAWRIRRTRFDVSEPADGLLRFEITWKRKEHGRTVEPIRRFETDFYVERGYRS